MPPPKEALSPRALLREAWNASCGHLRLAERMAAPMAARLRDAQRSGRAPTRAEATLAATLSKELSEATARMERLKLYRRG